MADPHLTEPVVAEIKLSGATFWRGMLTRAAIFLPLAAIQFYRTGSNGGLPTGLWWGIVGVVAAAIIVSVALMVTRVRVTLSSVRIRRALGFEKVIPRQALSYGVLVQQYQQFGNRTVPMLLLVGHDGKRQLQLSGQFFSGDDQQQFVYLAGKHFQATQPDRSAGGAGRPFFDIMPGPINAAGVDQRHPGVLPLIERRPFAIAVVVVVAVIVITALVFTATTD